MEVNVITLENNQEYIIVDCLQDGTDKYIFLGNENDPLDKCVRKVIFKDGKDYIVKLDSDEEFEKVMLAFQNKHKGKVENNEE